MMKIRKTIYLLIFLVVIRSGCSLLPGANIDKKNSIILDGEGLMNARCVECHSLTRVEGARFTLEEWTTVIDRMLKKDIVMTAGERQILIDYLYQKYPADQNSGAKMDGQQLLNTRCVECHTLSRVERQKLSLEEWHILVDNMIGKGALLNTGEKEILIQYLVETYPAN